MSCDFDQLLDKALVGEASAAELTELQRHAAACPDCAELLAASRLVDEHIATMGEVLATTSKVDEFTERLAEKLPDEPLRSLPQRLADLWAALAVPGLRPAIAAATILLCFIVASPDDQRTTGSSSLVRPATMVATVASNQQQPVKHPLTVADLQAHRASTTAGDEVMAMTFEVDDLRVYWLFEPH